MEILETREYSWSTVNEIMSGILIVRQVNEGGWLANTNAAGPN